MRRLVLFAAGLGVSLLIPRAAADAFFTSALAAGYAAVGVLECCTPGAVPHPVWLPGIAIVRAVPNGETVTLLAAIAWGVAFSRIGHPTTGTSMHWTRRPVGAVVLMVPMIYLASLSGWQRLWPGLS